jgi:hypothetical protein
MLDPGHFGLAATAIGCIATTFIASRLSKPFRLAHLFTLAFCAIATGVALSFVAGYAYGTCEQVLNVCSKVTAETTWGVALPLIYSPVMWLIGCLGFAFRSKT